MPTGIYDHSNKKTQFCPKGHDKDTVGRLKNGQCVQCREEYFPKWYRKNRKRVIKAMRKYRKMNQKQLQEKAKIFLRKHSDRPYKYRLKFAFNLTPEDYMKILKKQKFACAICNLQIEFNVRKGKKRNFCVDHDHKTGEVRGLLCDSCNRGLGQFKDNLFIMKSAIKYLSFYLKRKKK